METNVLQKKYDKRTIFKREAWHAIEIANSPRFL